MHILYFILLPTILFANHDRCPSEDLRDNRPALDTYYESPSGHFWIHYDLAGNSAPDLNDDNDNGIPDYVESAAVAADSARYILTEVMGYIEEENDEDGKYDIYIVSLSSVLWGVCQAEAGGGSFIKIRNNYEGMSDFCDNQSDLLWLTIGHEFFHAIQNAYRLNSSGQFQSSYFRELTAMWFENIFVPDCYDFLDFVDMASYSLFNNPEQEFDEELTGNRGYSLALYAHYLSTVIDKNGYQDQTSSTIIREIWEDFSNGGTIFSSLKNILENNVYNTSFSESWLDFMSRNMLCGRFSNMSNDVYYHLGQTMINSPDLEYISLNTNSVVESQISIKDNAVSIRAYDPMYPISLTTELSGSYSWYGSLISNDIILDISEEANLELFSVDEADYLSFIFTNQTGTGELDLTLNISIKGCMDPSALNYHPEAIYDDGSCKFPNNLISIYPNPINLTVNTLNIIYDLYDGEIYLEIFDLNGKSISSNLFSLSYGRQYINYNSRLDIPSGIYFLKVSAGNKTDFIKLVNIK